MESGQEFGSYKLISQIGAGGMGEVWKAEDPRLRRTVAIKILPLESATNVESNARFMREARTAAQLYHPNIATIHSIEEHDGRLFIVMEYVEGESLALAIRAGRLGESEVAFIGKGVADALAEAHAAGIVHRDIKPDNVILSGQRVKVLDFGIAKKYQTEEEAGDEGSTFTDFRTQRGVILGTIQYMSPEQAMGKALDGRSDIFSLGVVLYEAATGRLPFKGETVTDTLTRIIRDEAPDLRATHPNLSPALADVIMKCLAKDRENRYERAGDLAAALDAIFLGSRTRPERHPQADVPTAVSVRPDEPVTAPDISPGGSKTVAEASRKGHGPWPWIFATTLVIALSVAGTVWYLTKDVTKSAAISHPPGTADRSATPAGTHGEVVAEPGSAADLPFEEEGDGELLAADSPRALEAAEADVRPSGPRPGPEPSGNDAVEGRGRLDSRVPRELPPEPSVDNPDAAKAEAYMRRGVWFVAHGREEEGIESLKRAVALDSRMARAYIPMGVVALRRERPEDAARAFNAAMKNSDSLGRKEVELARFGGAIADGDLGRMNDLCRTLPFDREFSELRRLARAAGADCAVPSSPPPPGRGPGPSGSPPRRNQ